MCISQPYCLGVPAAKKPSLLSPKQSRGRFWASLKFGCSSRSDTTWVTLTYLPWGANDHNKGKEMEETPWLFFSGSPAVGSFPCSTSKHGYNVNETIVITVIIIIKTLKTHAAFLGWKGSNSGCPFLRRLFSLTLQVAMVVFHYPLRWWWAFLLLGKSWEPEKSKKHSGDNAVRQLLSLSK